MEFLLDYGLFLAKAVTIVVAIMIVLGTIISASQKNKPSGRGEIRVTNLGETIKEMADTIRHNVLEKMELKHRDKELKKQEKEAAKARKKAFKADPKAATEEAVTPDTSSESSENDNSDGGALTKPNLFVLNFEGDVKASAVESLREEITAIIAAAKTGDEVLVRLESPGGMVHTYGLASSQLRRLREKNIKLTIAVDEVAASGGYMMACVADKIISAPFAVVGSIGVVAQLPNFHRVLQKNAVDYEQHTAGEYKRTLTMFGENTDAAREKFQQELEETHDLFKAFIRENRPALDVDKVATGEHWYGTQALELGLIDQLQTSDDFLLNAIDSMDVYSVQYEVKKPLTQRLAISLQEGADNLLLNWWNRGENSSVFKR